MHFAAPCSAKETTMRQHYQTTTYKARRLVLTALSAAILVAAGVTLLLAYFDVLIK